MFFSVTKKIEKDTRAVFLSSQTEKDPVSAIEVSIGSFGTAEPRFGTRSFARLTVRQTKRRGDIES